MRPQAGVCGQARRKLKPLEMTERFEFVARLPTHRA
jgi:hypothetical protein